MAAQPAFEMQVIESGLTDGYWIQAGLPAPGKKSVVEVVLQDS